MNKRRRKCKVCKEWFEPKYNTLQVACCIGHAIEYANTLKDKEAAKRHRRIKEDLRSVRDWEKILTAVFNKWIRKRDEFKGCVSCGASLIGVKYDAGHCFPAGHYPHIRYHEDNVHGQCVECNQHRHGNQAEYLLRLPDRIGQGRYNELLILRSVKSSDVNKRTVGEVKEMIAKYKKLLKNETS